MSSQHEKGEQFAQLHEGPATFFVPNPWDVGTARLLAHLGFKALATTGAGYAFSSGRPDGAARPEEQLAYACTASELDAGSLSCDLARPAGWGKIAIHVCTPAVLDHGSSLRLAGPAGP